MIVGAIRVGKETFAVKPVLPGFSDRIVLRNVIIHAKVATHLMVFVIKGVSLAGREDTVNNSVPTIRLDQSVQINVVIVLIHCSVIT